ncbi:MAG: CDP-diacylglycerol--glycerol-3-phosphate 3-phosphatidyltransferase [Gemmatimonadota bacterium]
MAQRRLNLPNIITGARILTCPVIFLLALSPRISHLFIAFALFTAAAVSDLWDGYLARKHGLVTDIGKLLDPAADKLLMVSTFLPFYIVSHRQDPFTAIPWWEVLPLWVLLVIFLREIAVTVFRSWAARRGEVLSAGQSGKIKAFSQNIFSGSLLLWYALVRVAADRGWAGSSFWSFWEWLHGGVVALTLGIALILTVYSLGVYAIQNRRLVQGNSSGEG